MKLGLKMRKRLREKVVRKKRKKKERERKKRGDDLIDSSMQEGSCRCSRKQTIRLGMTCSYF